jgi:hypothetical protein
VLCGAENAILEGLSGSQSIFFSELNCAMKGGNDLQVVK